MKKPKIVAIIVASALIVIGLFVGFIGFSAIDYDISGLNTANFVTNTYDVNETFSNIIVEDTISDVRFGLSDDGLCKVVCHESDKLTCSVVVENNTLTIRETDNRKWYDHIGIFLEEMEIVIYLPQWEYDLLNVTSSVGDVEVTKDFSFKKTEIKTSTGFVDFSAAVENELSIKTDTGDIKVAGVNLDRLNFETDTGSITVNSVKAQENIEIETDTGKVNITDVKSRNITAESSTGDMIFKNVIVSGSVHIESNTGDVELLACDAGSIYIETSTGDVRGMLISEMVFITETDTGNVSVPKTVADGKCEVKTDTGDIEFTID